MSKRILHVLTDILWGKPNVCDDGGIRSLHFSGGTVQSSMRVSDPFDLDLSYTRAMMGFLLFNAKPRHILLVGLGGGSLSKYCYRQFPQARVTTLEISQDVIALRDEFLVPQDDERFHVVHTDACDYLAHGKAQADVILLDGYDATGLPDCLCSESFYSSCWRALATPGVLVANLWGGETHRTRFVDRLRTVFNGRVWWCRPVDSSSLIVFAVKDENFYPRWSDLMSKAKALEAQYHLDLSRLVKQMQLREEPDG